MLVDLLEDVPAGSKGVLVDAPVDPARLERFFAERKGGITHSSTPSPMASLTLELVLTLEIPTTGLRQSIAELARRYAVAYAMDGAAAVEQVITRLSGDDALPDETSRKLALGRAKIIDGPTAVTVLDRYFDETRAADQYGGHVDSRRNPGRFASPLSLSEDQP